MSNLGMHLNLNISLKLSHSSNIGHKLIKQQKIGKTFQVLNAVYKDDFSELVSLKIQELDLYESD